VAAEDPAAEPAPDAIGRIAELLLSRHPVRFAVAADDEERAIAYRLRGTAVIDQGWVTAEALVDGQERDDFDDHAVQIVGRLGGTPVATGRIVLPPGDLPTELACGITVEPAGRVADVGRLVVARSHQDPSHRTLVALLSALYLEVRRLGYEVACGMMAANVRALARQLGLRLEVLGEERLHWHELRAPIRFELGANTDSVRERWAAS
jgi:hypothetical protein